MRLAAIDIGTNSIHMIVVQIRPDLSFEVIDREKEMVRLGAGGLDGRSLTPAAMHAALQVLSKFGRLAESHNVEEVIARLHEYGYLDDAKFAQSYASLRVQQRPIGRRRLQRDLWLKKVDKQTAEVALDEAFSATPEEDLIDRAIAKRIRLRGRPKSREEAKKLFDHLIRQGFAFELVSDKVHAILKSEVDEPGQ